MCLNACPPNLSHNLSIAGSLLDVHRILDVFRSIHLVRRKYQVLVSSRLFICRPSKSKLDGAATFLPQQQKHLVMRLPCMLALMFHQNGFPTLVTRSNLSNFAGKSCCSTHTSVKPNYLRTQDLSPYKIQLMCCRQKGARP